MQRHLDLVFFAWRKGGLALADIVVLACLIAATMRACGKVRPRAAVPLGPYLIRALYATR